MVPAEDVNDAVLRDLPKAMELLKEMNQNTVQVAQLVDDMVDRVKRGELSTDKGLSFLEVKYRMLLSYLINLTYVVLRKCSGEPIEADPAIDRLVELRTVLEKMRPIDRKLKYQVDKLVKAAVTGSVSQNDPTSFKPAPDNMESMLEGSGSDNEDDEDGENEPSAKKGKYVPPKLATVPYDGDFNNQEREEQMLERARVRALSSTMIQDLKEEYLDTPLEITHGSARHAERSRQQRAREEYEENYFTRLPVTRTDRHFARQQSSLATIANQLTSFGDLSALDGAASGSAAKTKSRKRSLSKHKGKKSLKRKKRSM